MTQDYAKRRHSNRSPKPAASVPGWVWLFTGTVLGAFVMFLFYLRDVPPQEGDVISGLENFLEEQRRAMAQQQGQEDEETELPKPRFDFYKILQEDEVKVEVEPLPEAQREAIEYILQVGSFRNLADADRLRAQLILENMDAHVERVSVRNNEVWHRVLVGPYDSRSRMARVQSQLLQKRIESIVLKRPKAGE